MQEKIKDIESLVQEAPELEQPIDDYKTRLVDAESIHQELDSDYKKFETKKSDNIISRVRDSVIKYFGGEVEVETFTDQRNQYIKQLTTIAKDCKKALVQGGKAKKKVSDLEERITVSLLKDKNGFLEFNDYLTKLQDAIAYTESMLEEDNSLEEESVLRSQFNQLKEKENDTYTKLDQISIRITQTAVHKKQAREYVRYADTQSYRIQQSLQTAEYTIAFLEATDGLSEFLKAGSFAAQLHNLFEGSRELTGETDELLINALDTLGALQLPENANISLQDANDYAAQKMRKDMTERIASARGIIEAI